MAKTTRQSPKFQIRLPDDLLERVRAAADSSGRTMTAEIVATLEEKYPAPAPASSEELEAAIRTINELLERGGPEGQSEKIAELGRLLVERWFEPPEEVTPKKKSGKLNRT